MSVCISMDFPIACSLTESQLADRKRMLQDSIRKDMLRVARLPAANAYDFPMTSEMLENTQHLVEMERQCCRFLTFTINMILDTVPVRSVLIGGLFIIAGGAISTFGNSN